MSLRRRFGWFPLAVGATFVVALAIRLLAADAFMNPLRGGDDYYFHGQANLLADGHWFKHPFTFAFQGRLEDSAIHPPAYTVVLTLGSLLGLRSYAAHVYLSCFVGAATVVVVALVGRRLAGERVGVVAGVIAAVYPNLWLHETAGMSECLYGLLLALIVLVAVGAWSAPDLRRAALLGGLVGLAILTRGEALALLPLAVWPVFVRPGVRQWRAAAIATAATLALVVPWSAWNSARFGELVLVSVNSEEVLALANCPLTYGEPDLGHWTPACYIGEPTGNEAERGSYWRERGLRYMHSHVGRLPVVVAARLGGTLGVFRPIKHVDYGVGEGRDRTWGLVGMAAYAALAPAAVVGAVLLRRRRRPLWPVVAPVVMVLGVSAVIYGSIRFRFAAEVPIVVLAAVLIDRALPRSRA